MIRIEYDGKWPCLCSGHLKVWIDETFYDFGKHVLLSGGSIQRDENWDMWSTEGPWDIDSYPPNFPEDKKEELIRVINAEIPWGCCGGCI